MRLPTPTKQRLLELFILGVPSYRQRFASGTSAVSRERFNRLLRACCAKAEQLHEHFDEVLEFDDEGGRTGVRHGCKLSNGSIAIAFAFDQGRIKARPADASELRQRNNGVEESTPHGADAPCGYTILRLRGDHISLGKEKAQRTGRSQLDWIDGFWSFAKTWLGPYRSVPRRYFHLYLAEACYRYNHRNEDIGPLMQDLLRALSIQELRPIMVRKK